MTEAEEIRASQLARRSQKNQTQRSEAESGKTSLTGVSMDSDIYEGKGSRFANHDLSIDVGGAGPMEEDGDEGTEVSLLDSCRHIRSTLALLRSSLVD